jgi:hypothetical protein
MDALVERKTWWVGAMGARNAMRYDFSAAWLVAITYRAIGEDIVPDRLPPAWTAPMMA